MKLIFIGIGFIMGIFFTMKFPQGAADIADWIMQNQIVTEILR